jgi:hypothetical protein
VGETEKHEAVMKTITASETSDESADDDERRRISKLEKNKGGSIYSVGEVSYRRS